MSFWKFHNMGANLAAADTGIIYAATAGAAPDNTEQAGSVVDRVNNRMPLSASLLIKYKAVLGAGNTLSLGYRLEHGEAANLADTANLIAKAVAGNVVATGPAGGGTVQGVLKVDVDLGSAGRYLRTDVTSDLSAANTDTCLVSAVLLVGGEDVTPAV